MGTQVAVGGDGSSKQQMVISSVSAGSVEPDIVGNELIVWIGDNAQENQVEMVAALKRCRDTIFENGAINPFVGAAVTGMSAPGLAKGQTVFKEGGPGDRMPTNVTEGNVLVSYSQDFALEGASTILGSRIDAAIDKLVEDVAKAA